MGNVTDTATSNQSALLMIRGLPGSGKSYLADALQKSIGDDMTVILDPDRIDSTSEEYQELSKALTAEGVELKFHPNRFLKEKGYEAITAGKVVIWNQAFTDLGGFGRSAGRLQEFAAEHHIPLPLLVVEVQISYDVAKARVADRVQQGGHDVPEEAFARFINDYKSFADEGYDTVAVNGDDDVSTSTATVLKALQELRQQYAAVS